MNAASSHDSDPPAATVHGREETVGAILAGGLSTRMGEPKHSLRLSNGRMMIEHVRAALETVCPRIVIISSEELVPGVQHIADNFDQLGPLGGIEALLSSALARNYLVVPCDMPLLNGDILGPLLKTTAHPITVLRVAGETGPRPLPLRISDAVLPIIWSRIEEGALALTGLLDAMKVEIVDVPHEWAPALVNINTPEEFVSLSRSMRPQHPHD